MDYNNRSALVLKEENCIGQIQKVFGKEGELVVKIWDNFPDDFLEEPFWIEIDSKGVPLFVKSVKRQGLSKIIAVFEDWQSEDLATELVGKNLYFEFQDDEDETGDIVGWILKDISSGLEGTIVGVSDSELNPLLFVEIGGKECMIPFAENLIVGIDEIKQIISMNLPEGLLEL